MHLAEIGVKMQYALLA